MDKKSNDGANGSATAHSDQLREIQNLLFGEQLSSVEGEIDSFRKEVDSRFSDLEMTLQSSIDIQAADVSKELESLSSAIAQLERTQQTDMNSVDESFKKVNELIKTNHREQVKETKALQRRLDTETEKLKKLIADQKKELQEQIQKSVDNLTDTKTDRKQLAAMLQVMVKNLEA